MKGRIVTFKVDEGLLRLLDAYARMHNMSRSEVIREAIIRLLEGEGYRVDSHISDTCRGCIEFEVEV